MKIAIVGGGAAGVAACYLLAPAHRVTLYERAPLLGNPEHHRFEAAH